MSNRKEQMRHPICSFISLWLPTAAAAVIIGAILVKGWIAGVEILAVELILCDSECIAEALEMNSLTLAQEPQGISHIGIIYEPDEVVISDTGLLLCRKVLVKIGKNISLYSDIFHVKGSAGCGNRINTRRMIDKIRRKAAFFDLFLAQTLC